MTETVEPGHPVDELDPVFFTAAAIDMARQLAQHGAGAVELCPGDATSYKLMLARNPRKGPEGPSSDYWFASSFGTLYPWNVEMDVHWDYAASHYTHDNHEWTGRVIARFLSSLTEALEGLS